MDLLSRTGVLQVPPRVLSEHLCQGAEAALHPGPCGMFTWCAQVPPGWVLPCGSAAAFGHAGFVVSWGTHSVKGQRDPEKSFGLFLSWLLFVSFECIRKKKGSQEWGD